ncbi:alpha-hydroxy acid oxidase [Longimicrobium sp.]|uniref:alpha-hydroxy acid oxidase n=1 Tax=Longimicrobium sp. TaxID=2029185 RepID=UPI003B3B37B7
MTPEDPRPASCEALEPAARAVLSEAAYHYYAGGADDETTLRANRAAFERFYLRPRVLRDVSEVDTSVELLGERLSMPILLAPTAFQRLAHAEGEKASARAARAAGTLMVASTLSTTPIEEVAAAAPGPLWFQLYVFRQRDITRALVERAEAAGCTAICLTVTVPVQGNRERDTRTGFRLPPELEMANFAGLRQAAFPDDAAGSGLAAFIGREFDPTLTWGAVEWLRSITRLPIVLKGIVTPEDAALAVEHGADAVIVSNHGGRQLDCAEPTLLALPRVAQAVAGRIPVLMDGGIRRGTDVAKALALGARAVLVGRPVLWGLAVDGQAGVERVLDMLGGELRRTLALLGRPSVRALDASAITEIPGLILPPR